jgi:hypothetical protein
MKKIFGKGVFAVFFISAVILLITNNVKAVNINFGTIGKTAETTEEFIIYANPGKEDTLGITINISAENAEFIGYTASPLFQIGTCTGNVKYTKNQVCVDVIKSTPFKSTDKIGTLKIKWGPMNGEAKINVGDKYFSETKELSKNTKVNSFTIIGGIERPVVSNTPVIEPTINNTTTNVLTIESLKNQTNAVIFISVGAILILLSMIFVTKLKKK